MQEVYIPSQSFIYIVVAIYLEHNGVITLRELFASTELFGGKKNEKPKKEYKKYPER